MKSILLLTVFWVSCSSRTPDAIVIDVPTDSTFVSHKFLSGEMARLNNEIVVLRDSLDKKKKPLMSSCFWEFPDGAVIGSFDYTGTTCHSNEEVWKRFNIIWNGERAVIKEAFTILDYPKSADKPIKKS